MLFVRAGFGGKPHPVDGDDAGLDVCLDRIARSFPAAGQLALVASNGQPSKRWND